MDEALRRAGAAAIRFNAPLSDARAAALVAAIGEAGADIVDIGCGRGALAIEVARRFPAARVLGLDIDEVVLAAAREAAADLEGNLRLECVDAGEWSGPADVVTCIGSAHALGGTAAMFERLRERAGAAVVGDGVWAQPPDPENRARFGPLVDGLEGLRACAEAAGWFVEQAWLSTLEEWDAFEAGWNGGVRAVGTPEALAFAAARAATYATYRGVLGFGWLVLRAKS